MPQRTIRIATRRSRLAMWQAEHVKRLLERDSSETSCELVPMDTSGDLTQDRPLRRMGGKGLFLKELEKALIDDQADVAVHSMKDVPIQLESAFRLQTIGERGPAHDVLVGYSAVHEMPPEVTIGTSSSRRRALLAHVYKRRRTNEIRGNVETRLRKLDEGQVEGLVLAAAGLKRLGLAERVCAVLPKDVFIPAAGQGVLAVEYLKDQDQIRTLLEAQINRDVEQAAAAERAVAEFVGADCTGAFGAYCERLQDGFRLSAIALSESGDHAIQATTEDSDAFRAAEVVGERLLKQGARELLHET